MFYYIGPLAVENSRESPPTQPGSNPCQRLAAGSNAPPGKPQPPDSLVPVGRLVEAKKEFLRSLNLRLGDRELRDCSELRMLWPPSAGPVFGVSKASTYDEQLHGFARYGARGFRASSSNPAAIRF